MSCNIQSSVWTPAKLKAKLSGKTAAELIRWFRLHDLDDNWLLDEREIARALMTMNIEDQQDLHDKGYAMPFGGGVFEGECSPQIPHKFVQDLIKEIDTDADCNISLTELTMWCNHPKSRGERCQSCPR